MLVALAALALGRGSLPAPKAREQQPSVARVALTCAIRVAVYGAMLVQCTALRRWVDAGLDAHVLGVEVPGSWLLQLPVNASLVILLAPLAALAYARLRIWTSIALGCALIAVALLVPLGVVDALEHGEASAGWPIASTLALSMGELLVGPLALSLVTAHAPRPWVATAAACWIVSRDLLAEHPARAIDATIELAPAAPLWVAAGLAVAGRSRRALPTTSKRASPSVATCVGVVLERSRRAPLFGRSGSRTDYWCPPAATTGASQAGTGFATMVSAPERDRATRRGQATRRRGRVHGAAPRGRDEAAYRHGIIE